MDLIYTDKENDYSAYMLGDKKYHIIHGNADNNDTYSFITYESDFDFNTVHNFMSDYLKENDLSAAKGINVKNSGEKLFENDNFVLYRKHSGDEKTNFYYLTNKKDNFSMEFSSESSFFEIIEYAIEHFSEIKDGYVNFKLVKNNLLTKINEFKDKINDNEDKTLLIPSFLKLVIERNNFSNISFCMDSVIDEKVKNIFALLKDKFNDDFTKIPRFIDFLNFFVSNRDKSLVFDKEDDINAISKIVSISFAILKEKENNSDYVYEGIEDLDEIISLYYKLSFKAQKVIYPVVSWIFSNSSDKREILKPVSNNKVLSKGTISE